MHVQTDYHTCLGQQTDDHVMARLGEHNHRHLSSTALESLHLVVEVPHSQQKIVAPSTGEGSVIWRKVG